MSGFCVLKSFTTCCRASVSPQSISQYSSITAPGAGTSVGIGDGPTSAVASVLPSVVIVASVALVASGAAVASSAAGAVACGATEASGAALVDPGVGAVTAGEPPHAPRISESKMRSVKEIDTREG